MANSKGSKLLKGAAILGIASIFVKIIGAVFRLPLTNLIGDVGMSYYGVAYSVYSALLVLAISGMPVAISRMVAERIALREYKNAHNVFIVALKLMFGIGFFSFSVCYFGGDTIARLMGNPEAGAAVKAIAPALLFVPMLASCRGYFQGRQNMNPTAISEVIEQLVRAAVGLTLAYTYVSTSKASAAAGASLGASVGSLASLIILTLIYFANKKAFNYKIERHSQHVEPTSQILKKIIYIAVPIIIGAEIMPIMGMIDTGIIMNRLQATGWSLLEAKGLFGLFSGFVNPIVSLPQIFTVAVAVSLVPAISSCAGAGDKEGVRANAALSLRTTMIMACPCAFGIFFLSRPILHMLYFAQKDSAEKAVPIMMIMAIGILLLAISQTLTGILQSIGKQTLPVRNLALGCVFKVILTYILVGIPAINVNGAAIGTLVAYTIAMVMNFIDVIKFTGLKLDFVLTYIKPTLAAVIMGICAYITHMVINGALGNTIATMVAVMVGGAVYVVLIFALKAITFEEVSTIPVLSKLSRAVAKFSRG